MTADQLKDWMQRTGTTKVALHQKTGIARTTIDRYLAGTYPIPKVVSLALAALEAGIGVEG